MRSDGSISDFEKDRIPSVPNGAPVEVVSSSLVRTIVDYVRRVEGDVGPGAPISISVPGPVEPGGVIHIAAPLFGEERPDLALASQVEKHTERECFVLNDVSAATWYFSERFDADRFMVVTVSSGLGSKLFDRSRKYGVIDEVDFAGEIGHITIDYGAGALPCDCGGRGHLSSISSGRGVQRYAVQLAFEDPESFKRSILYARTSGDPGTMTNEGHIVPAILEGDPWARDVLTHCSYPLAQMLSVVTAAAGLQKIAIIGGFALSLGPAYLQVLNECFEHHKDFELMTKRLDDLLWMEDELMEECLLGAAAYGRRRIIAESEEWSWEPVFSAARR
jgi:C7-cyclitol 7-kinase